MLFVFCDAGRMSNSTEEEPRNKKSLSESDEKESKVEGVKKLKQGVSLPQGATRLDDNHNPDSNPNPKPKLFNILRLSH